jgi:hypothetical protein
MANYLLLYKGGGMPETDAEREAVTAAWGAWFGELDGAVVDAGNPFGASSSVSSGGSVSEGASSGATGYSVVTADDLAGAVALAKGCPILASGGSVEVHETFEVM